MLKFTVYLQLLGGDVKNMTDDNRRRNANAPTRIDSSFNACVLDMRT